jgi:hypothetical protein
MPTSPDNSGASVASPVGASVGASVGISVAGISVAGASVAGASVAGGASVVAGAQAVSARIDIMRIAVRLCHIFLDISFFSFTDEYETLYHYERWVASR